MNRLEVLLTQFDGLVVFLPASSDEVFQLIRRKELPGFPSSQDPHAPETFEGCQTALCNAAFLLGYAYLEAFLADIVKQSLPSPAFDAARVPPWP
jgi:hypothetical protein